MCVYMCAQYTHTHTHAHTHITQTTNHEINKTHIHKKKTQTHINIHIYARSTSTEHTHTLTHTHTQHTTHTHTPPCLEAQHNSWNCHKKSQNNTIPGIDLFPHFQSVCQNPSNRGSTHREGCTVATWFV